MPDNLITPGTSRIAIVTGCPGTGKTTLATALAAANPRGVHLVSDRFYEFFSHPVVPIRPESHGQNTAAVRAIAAASGAFATGGYEVFVDGIFGPWFLPTFLAEIELVGVEVDYIVLRAALPETLQRAMSRTTAKPEDEEIVRHMHRQLADLGRFEPNAIDTTGLSFADTLALIDRERPTGRFALR
jgi:predicted kinase